MADEKEQTGEIQKKSWFKRLQFWIGVGTAFGGLLFGMGNAPRKIEPKPGRGPASERAGEEDDYSSEGLEERFKALQKAFKEKSMYIAELEAKLNQHIAKVEETVEGNRKEAREDNGRVLSRLDKLDDKIDQLIELTLKRTPRDVAAIQLFDSQTKKASNN